MDVPIPLLNALPTTNSLQIDLAAQQVLRLGVRKIAVLGLAFKPGTDDLRESPAVILVKRLLGEGCEVRIYDPAVYQARLMGTNLAYIQYNLPHFEALLVPEPQQALEEFAELVVVTHATPEFSQILLKLPKEIRILDLAGVFTESPKEFEYHGIAW
jgi:GDP-mannose 6-dehydrogenase